MATPLPMGTSKGQGIVFLSFHELPGCLNALSMTDIQGNLQENGTFAALREYLLLPDTYAVLGIFLDRLRGLWAIIVENADIPPGVEGEVMPEVVLTYRREGQVNHLEKIEVQKNRFAW